MMAHPQFLKQSRPVLGFSITDALLWAVVLLSPFQDTFLQNTPLKLPAASFSFLPLMALFFIAVVRHFWYRPLIFNRTGLLMVAYAFLICAIHFVSVEQGDIVFNQRSVFAFALLSSLFLFVLFGLDYRDTPSLRIAVYLSFLITVVGIASDQLIGANAIAPLQVTPSLSGRPHGFSTEASTLSIQIVASGMLTAHFLRKPWQKWCVGIITCALLIFSSSKGAFISLLLCAVVLGIVRMRSSPTAKIIGVVVLVPVVYFGSALILASFGSIIDANETSTIATRLSMPLFAMITVFHNPFGVGFTGFLPSIPRYLPTAMRFVQSLFPFPLFFGEAQEYLYPPQTNADCKALFFDYLVFFGIPFAVVFFIFVKRLLVRLYRCKCYWLFIGVLFCVLAMMTYYSTLHAWTLPLLFGMSLYEVNRLEAAARAGTAGKD